MKRIWFLALVLCFVPVSFSNGYSGAVVAEEFAYESQEVEDRLGEEIEGRLKLIDFNDLETSLQELTSVQSNFFQSKSFFQKVSSVIGGGYVNSQSFLSSIFSLVFDNILDIIPLLTSIVAISVLCGFVSALKSEKNGKSIADIVHFACYGIIVVLVVSATKQCIDLARQTLLQLTNQMQAIFPVLLTLILAVGGNSSATVFQPSMALLCSVVITLFNNFVMPLFLFSLVFSVVSNLTKTVKLEKFSQFLNSTFKWTIGIIFTVFSAFISVQGISAGKFDGISYKTAKYTIKGAVPIVGGYLSDGFDLLLSSTVIIKNAIGVTGLILLASTIIVPVVKIVVFSLCLKLTGAILEPLGDGLTSNFVTSLSKSIPMLVGMILVVGFMFLLSLGMLVMTANYV